MLRQARARHLIWIGTAPPTDLEQWRDADLDVQCVDPDGPAVTAGVAASARGASRALPAPLPDDAAYMFFTSGSTGVPKGVLGSHKGLSHFLTWQRGEFAVGREDRVAQLTALSFDVVLRDLFLPLISGATLCLPDRADVLAGAQVLDWLARERVTILHTVPALAQSWLRDRPSDALAGDLRLVFFAGEPLLDRLVTQWRNACGRQCEIVNLYGPTETSLAKYYHRVAEPPLPGIQPVGRPLPHTQTLLLGPGGTRAGLGEVGEIVIRTPFRTLGYLGDTGGPSRFVTNPFTGDPRDIVYRTGDLGRHRFDGTLDILGRMDDQLKIHGVRVEPGEIAAALSDHESLQACTVIARKDGKGDCSLCAYVVPKPGAEVHPSELRRHLAQRLPVTVVPRSFVVLESLPLLANGKVDRAALPAPAPGQPGPAVAHATPPGALAGRLVEIWEDVLGIRPIGVDDDFFALGGSSLLGVRLVERINRQLGLTVPLVTIVEAPTIALLARRLETCAAAGERRTDVPFNARGRQRPLFALPGTGGTAAFTFRPLAAELGPDQPVHGLQLRGLDGMAPPDRTVEAMARHQVANVRRIQPSGPYLLMGYSFGGRLALEMAIQLRAAGERVALLAMIDSSAPGFPRVDPLPQRLRLHLGELRSRGFVGGIRYIGERARRLTGRAGQAVRRLLPHRIVRTADLEAHLRAIDLVTQRASRQYVPQKYDGDLLLFRSQERSQWLGSSYDDPRNGWGEFVLGEIEVRAIPGTHLEAMAGGSIHVIAECLRTALSTLPP
jgi:amino acid adenylation domain-containing protein